VLQARVFAFSILSNDAKIDILVSRVEAGDVLDQNDRGIDIKLLAERDVE